jgi:cysteine desulfurase
VIYLDHNATTPVLPAVRDAMMVFLERDWGNPSAAYQFGASASQALVQAREQVASLLNADPIEVVFTSGATEANNTALHSALQAFPNKRHVISTEVEHSSIINYCAALQKRDIEVTLLPVDRSGYLDPELLKQALRPETAVVSIMWANNETGVILPVERYAEICRRAGVLFHCDAVQAVGKVPVDFRGVGCDYLTLSGHKIGAAKGVGSLIVAEAAPFAPLIIGGKQESGRRGGTEPVASIVGLGMACAIAERRSPNAWAAVAALRDQLEQRILTEIPGSYRNGDAAARLPNTLNCGIRGVDSDALVAYLDRHDICVSSGSACMEQSLSPSHVISAMTRDHARAQEALRISLGLTTVASDLDRCFQLIQQLVATLR